jgi:hypothetical protein
LVVLAGAVLPAQTAEIAREPLLPPVGPRGATMFAELPAEATGIVTRNDYADPRMWGGRFHESDVGEIGTGVAVGDYDNDGLPDLFVVSKVETCRLFHNRGGWKFEDVTERARIGDSSGEWKQGASFVDVNNDGWLDIYVCRFAAPNLLFINQSDGTFREEAGPRGLAVTDGSAMAAFADYDRDGWLDVYLHTNLLDATAYPDGQPDYLFHNNGDGTFTNVTARAGIRGETQGHSATWWDFDDDGWPDLYVANDFTAPDFLYHNNRDGTFSNVAGLVLPHTAGTAMGADLGDVNNDGRIDLMVADMAATTHEKDQRGMADTRAQTRDHDPREPRFAPQVARNALYLNTGTGHFLEAACLAGIAATDWTWSVRWADFDEDGRLDLFVTNGMDREQTNVDLLRSMMKAESAIERVRLMRASPILNETNLVYRNAGDLRFEEVGREWGLDRKGVSFGAATGDFDGDGDLDLVYTNYQRGVTVLRNDCDRGHRLVVRLRGVASNRFGVGASVRIETSEGVQVRQLVLARGYLSMSEPALFFGLGDATQIKRMVVSWPSGRTQIFENLAADFRYTIAEPSADSPTSAAKTAAGSAGGGTMFREAGAEIGLRRQSREEVLEGTVEQPGLPRRFNRRGPGLAIGDIDGDGTDEILIGGTTKDPARLLRNAGGHYKLVAGPISATPPPVNAGPPLITTVAADDRQDVLLTRGGAAVLAEEPAYEPKLFLNDGHGKRVAANDGAIPSLPTSVGAVAAADFDRDGRLDIFIGGRVTPGFFPEIPRSALWMNRDGKLVDATDEFAPVLANVGMVTSALWSDVDGDGWSDLVVALDWGTIRYFHNEAGTRLEDRTAGSGFDLAGRGRWTGLASADFNGDGRPDFVAGNLGLNTPRPASPEQPEFLFADDFTGSGAPQIVTAHAEDGRLVPWQSRRELAAFLPEIMKKFPRNDDFARASLEEIVGKERLTQATRLEATELRSGVFLSQPDGHYRFAPLPRIAQVAPAQGIAAGDFDGDGRADIFLVQNSYEPAPSIGRFDGGLGQLLTGDGKGGFRPIEPARSGLVVPGDAKALAVVDFNRDGWPDFFVTRNNETSLAFENRGAEGRRMLSIRLRGHRGNPAAIGSIVTVEFADGKTQRAEVFAGGGFASQSTAACFFGVEKENVPRRVRVRWPNGGISEEAIPAECTLCTIAQRN